MVPPRSSQQAEYFGLVVMMIRLQNLKFIKGSDVERHCTAHDWHAPPSRQQKPGTIMWVGHLCCWTRTRYYCIPDHQSHTIPHINISLSIKQLQLNNKPKDVCKAHSDQTKIWVVIIYCIGGGTVVHYTLTIKMHIYSSRLMKLGVLGLSFNEVLDGVKELPCVKITTVLKVLHNRVKKL